MKKNKSYILATIIIISIVFVVLLINGVKQGIVNWLEMSEDEFAKMQGRDDLVSFGDGTYKILEATNYERKQIYPLYKVLNGGFCYLLVEEYKVINHIAYIKGMDQQDYAIKLYAVLDYNNDKIKVESDISKFSTEEMNIFQNEEFINLYNSSNNIVKTYD